MENINGQANSAEKLKLAEILAPFIGIVLVEKLEAQDPPIDGKPMKVQLKKDQFGNELGWKGAKNQYRSYLSTNELKTHLDLLFNDVKYVPMCHIRVDHMLKL